VPSPFPGMDPYLEGHLWSDVHSRLAAQISDQLAPLIEPRYVARLATRFVSDYLQPAQIGIIYPDVDITPTGQPPAPPPREDTGDAAILTLPAITPAPLVLPTPIRTQVRLVTVEIRDAVGNELITAIEVLSPTNKREPGATEYREKREFILGSRAHLLEIDLLHQGQRPVQPGGLPDAPYFVFLTRDGRRFEVEIWPISLHDPLPVVPVPLRAPDADVPLDLGAALSAIYDRARYHLSIDYSREPDVPLSGEDAVWAAEHLQHAGIRQSRS